MESGECGGKGRARPQVELGWSLNAVKDLICICFPEHSQPLCYYYRIYLRIILLRRRTFTVVIVYVAFLPVEKLEYSAGEP